MNSNTKKAMSVVLCTTLLSTGGLAALTNIAHASSNNEMCSRSISKSWTETLHLRLQRKTGSGRADLKLNLKSENGKIRLECNYDIPSMYDYWFGDTFVFGIRSYNRGNHDFKLNNVGIGSFRNGNISSKIKDFIDKFNALDINSDDNVFFYAHGVDKNDSLTFSGENINRPTTKKDYSKGYYSRGIDKWNNGFQLRSTGIYECALMHK